MRTVGLFAFAVLVLSACSAGGGGDAGTSDMGRDCDGAVGIGCPCSTPGQVVCGNPDYLCATGVWVMAADACGELDVGRRDAGPVDTGVGPPCTNEGQLQCLGGGGQVCCGGHLRSFSDGPCGLLYDGGAVDAGADVDASLCWPLQPGCPCDATADAGAAVCFFERVLACNAGTWAFTNTACPGFCP